ncbi:AAA domain containing protein [uncultured Caudovirales phage]|uniref:AAA domain containing protein n=1 Tax=uncultured Caudovirales phage TaxID=2100421 RepID=A0A6J5S1G1_9CAUD|nr:AAA domain containing protein [uncultured Caudovirales phage]
MQVSKMLGQAHATEVSVANLEELAKLATQKDYSLGVFEKGHRKADSFLKTEAIALDIDDGMTLDQAKKEFADYAHIILPTKSHRKEKNGKVADRFRVILPLEKPITDADTYYATWQALKDRYPAIDPACKDPSRMWYKSERVESLKAQGKKVSPVKPQPKPELKAVPALPEGVHGDLSKRTLKFLQLGAPKGQRHAELYQAARDAKQQGYTQEWFALQIANLVTSTGDRAYLDAGAKATIVDAFSKDPKHPPRVQETAFAFMGAKELLSKKLEIDWICERLLTAGGMSIIAAPPKCGKSTLARQLALAFLRGGNFLDRKCKQGTVVYISLEEQLEVIQEDFKRLGVNDTDSLMIHVGPLATQHATDELKNVLIAQRPIVCFIDTMFLFAPVKSDKDYMEVNAMLARIRNAARESGTHIVLIHHTRKPGKDERYMGAKGILGSQAIHGAVDCAIILEQEGQTRRISTSQRVGRRIPQRIVVFDEATHTMSLGPEIEEEFG